MATVIIGGLISSTLLEFFVRPALFWTFGRKAIMRSAKTWDKVDELAEPADSKSGEAFEEH